MSTQHIDTGHVADLLPAFANGTLSRSERAEVMAHLTRCAACAVDLRAWQAIQQATRIFASPLADTSHQQLERIWDVIDASPTVSRPDRTALKTRPSPEETMTSYTLPHQAIVPPVSVHGPVRRPQRRPSLRQDWGTLLAIAALLVLTLSGTLLQLMQPLDPSELRSVLPWQTATPPDVPTYRGDSQRSGVNPGPGPARKPEVLWQDSMGGSVSTTPTLVDGVIYVSSANGIVHALDAASGTERWGHDSGGNPSAHITVADGLVFAGDNDPYDALGNLLVLSADDGHEVWRLPDAQTSSPLVVDGSLYTSTGDGTFHAYDAATGTERWGVKAPVAYRGASYADGLVYYGDTDDAIHALDAATGEERWSFQTDGGRVGTNAVVDGTVYAFTFDGPADQMYALDAATGEEQWRFAINARLQPPAVRDGVVYVPGGDGSIYALNAASGTVRWRFDFGDPTVFAPILAGDTLYVTGGGPMLYAVDAASGQERWHVEAMGPFGSSPIVSGGVIYAATTTGQVFALGERESDAPALLPVPSNADIASGAATFLWRAKNGTEPIDEPHGMAVAPDGNLWLAEGGKNRFLIYSPDGALLETWGSPGPGEGEFDFYWPTGGGAYGGIAFDQDGNFFVADTGNHRIQKFDSQRQFVTAWGSNGDGDGQFVAPVHVATDGAGDVYVSDAGGIQRFSNDGEFLGRVGAWGSGVDQYTCTAVLGVDHQGNVYVPDCEANRVLQFNRDGDLLRTIGAAGRGAGELTFPSSVAIDGNGTIFVADGQNSRVEVFTPDGAFLAEWGSFGEEPGQFVETTSLAIDAAGDIYVTDYTLGTLQKFHPEPPRSPGVSAPAP